MSAPSEEPASEGAPEWMVSYADMITILMSFFAVMFSMAMSKDAKKDVPMMKSLQRQFGALPTTNYLPLGAALTPKAAATTIPQMESRNRSPGEEFAHASPSGDQATIGGVIYFDSGTSGLDEEQRRQLQTLAKVVGSKPGKIEILAHMLGRPRDADDKLGRTWNLAHARCNSTTRYLVSLGIDPERIRIGVAAQFEPNRVGGDTFLLEKNDSVEVFTLNEIPQDARAESTDHIRN
jgi:chemotaxis protein MotB